MPHNSPKETAYLIRDGVGSIVALKKYSQMGQTTVNNAIDNIIEFINDHSCLDKMFPRHTGWAFRCIYGAAGKN
jgi:hypothetical protein